MPPELLSEAVKFSARLSVGNKNCEPLEPMKFVRGRLTPVNYAIEN